MSLQKIITASISASASATATDAIQLNELTVAGITTGSAFSGSMMTFQVSLDNVTYYPLYNKDGEVAFSGTGGSAAIALSTDPSDFYGWNWLKVREGTSSSPVTQKRDACAINISAKLV